MVYFSSKKYKWTFLKEILMHTENKLTQEIYLRRKYVEKYLREFTHNCAKLIREDFNELAK